MEYLSLNKNTISLNTEKDHHGWIQFKGTNICLDVHCKCGELSHIDGDFVYFLQCPSCGLIYELNGYIELIERDIKDIDKDINVHKADL